MTNALLHYKSYGDSSNPACIILLHGMLGSMDNWRSQAKQLSAFFHVITPDLRNHGHSPHISGMRYQNMAQDVLDLTNHLGLQSFDLLGHSMGGKVAMEMALQPSQTIQRLLIVDIAPKPYELWHLATFKALLSLPIADLTSRSQADEFLANYIEDPFERAFLLKNLQSSKSGGYTWRCNLQEITRAYLNIANFTQQTNATFSGKTLFIKGGQSPYIDLETDPSIISTFFPEAVLQTIEGSGHNPHVEKAPSFYQTVSKFLDLSTTS